MTATHPEREEVDAPGLAHPQPIPVAVWIGGVLHSSPIGPRRADGTIPADLDQQLDVSFANLDRLLTAAGTTPSAVGFVNVQLADAGDRPAFNERWSAFFDEPRPARQILTSTLPAGVRVLFTITAYRER